MPETQRPTRLYGARTVRQLGRVSRLGLRGAVVVVQHAADARPSANGIPGIGSRARLNPEELEALLLKLLAI